MIDWRDRPVLVIGGAGLLGSHLVSLLVERGAKVTIFDLLLRAGREQIGWETPPGVKCMQGDAGDSYELLDAGIGRFLVIFNLAANVAGIVHNLSSPAEMMADNLAIKLGVYKALTHGGYRGYHDTDVFVDVSTVCVTPSEAPIPTPESFVDPLKGPWSPESSNFGYGIAKLCGEFLSLHLPIPRVLIARPSNLYGLRDYFGPGCHVIPGLIQRIAGGENPLKLWGGGQQTRTFVYAADAALALIELAERAPHKTICNIGVPEEVTIHEVAERICVVLDKAPQFEQDYGQPRGYHRRVPDLGVAESLGLTCTKNWVRLEDGIATTVAWWKAQGA